MCGHSAVQPLERGEWSDSGGRLEDGTTLSRGETEADWREEGDNTLTSYTSTLS